MFLLAFGPWQLSCLVVWVQSLPGTTPASSVLIDQMSMISFFFFFPCVFVLVISIRGGSLDLIDFLFHFLPVFYEWSSFLVLKQQVSMQFPLWNDFCHPFEFPAETLSSEGKTFLVGIKHSCVWKHSPYWKKGRKRKKCVKKIMKDSMLDSSLDKSLNE